MKRTSTRPLLERLEDRIALDAGDLDLSFGGGDGIATFHFNGPDAGRVLVVQPDGKFVVGGATSGPGGAPDFALVRFNANGTVDSGFGTQGVMQTDFDGHADLVYGLALQPDGKIIATGASFGPLGSRAALARFHPNGALDDTFGGDGRVTTDVAPGDDNAFAVALQPDGKIVIAGNSQPMPGLQHMRFLAARYNADGSPDDTFGSGGTTTTDFGPTDAVAWSVAVQPDGKIVAAGHSSTAGSNFGVAVARYNADGTPDLGFDGDGKTTADFAEGDIEAGRDLVLQPDGKILVVGFLRPQPGVGADILLARFHSNGSPDNSFGGDGEAVIALPNSFEAADGVALQSDGKIIVVGQRSLPAPGAVAALIARLLPDGTLDDTFGSPPSTLVPGVVLTDVLPADPDAFFDVRIVGNRILATGSADDGSNQSFLVARYELEDGGGGNEPPAAEAGGPYAVAEGGSVPLDGSGSTDPENGDLTYEWDLDGDGVFGETGPAALRGDETGPTPTFSAAGLDGPTQPVVSLRIRDPEGDTAVDTALVQVSNVAPVLNAFTSSASTPGAVLQGGVVIFSASFSDAGLPDTHRAVLDWGDGSPPEVFDLTGAAGGTLGASRPYAQPGVFTATLTLTDDDDASAVPRSARVVVSGVGLVNGILHIVGTDADDVVKLVRLPNKRIKVTTSFSPPRTFKPADVLQIDIRLFGGADRATVAAVLRQTATFDGGDGDDQLRAGGGSSVLLGGTGTDLLKGGSNRDLLIANTGTDVLRGGDGQDLLVAGRTLLEADRVALDAVMAEWRSAHPYLVRATNVAGVGNGSDFDARRNGNHFLKPNGADATVFAVAEAHDVRGDRGLDCFFANLNSAPATLLGGVSGSEVRFEID